MWTLLSLSLSLSLCFLCVATEHLPSCPSPTDWLSDFQLSLCYAVLAECLLSFSLPRVGLFDVVCLLFIFWHPPFPFAAALCKQEAVQQCLRVSVCLPHSSLCLPVYPLIRPSGVSRTMEMRSVQKTAWVFLPLHTNPSSLSLTDSPLTGWSIHRCLMDTNSCWHSQKSCQPVTTKIMKVISRTAA